MKNLKKVSIFLFLFFSAAAVFAQSAESSETAASSTETAIESATVSSSQFWPQFLSDARRFEIISLGSMPFVMLDCSLVYSGYKCVVNNFDTSYFNVFSSTNYSTDEIKGLLITSASIAVGIAVTDLVINLIRRNKTKKTETLDTIKIAPVDLNLPDGTNPTASSDEKQVE